MLRRDFADITVTDLCAAAEINRRTFYRHFTDKYQLVTWIYDRGFQKAIGDDEPGLFDLFVAVDQLLDGVGAVFPIFPIPRQILRFAIGQLLFRLGNLPLTDGQLPSGRC